MTNIGGDEPAKLVQHEKRSLTVAQSDQPRLLRFNYQQESISKEPENCSDSDDTNQGPEIDFSVGSDLIVDNFSEQQAGISFTLATSVS
jgi:hypothetical protein